MHTSTIYSVHYMYVHDGAMGLWVGVGGVGVGGGEWEGVNVNRLGVNAEVNSCQYGVGVGGMGVGEGGVARWWGARGGEEWGVNHV